MRQESGQWAVRVAQVTAAHFTIDIPGSFADAVCATPGSYPTLGSSLTKHGSSRPGVYLKITEWLKHLRPCFLTSHYDFASFQAHKLQMSSSLAHAPCKYRLFFPLNSSSSQTMDHDPFRGLYVRYPAWYLHYDS